jgi:ubiquinone/menaquinone biosynthesis C-methylase UbiE
MIENSLYRNTFEKTKSLTSNTRLFINLIKSIIPFQKGYTSELYSDFKEWLNELITSVRNSSDRYHRIYPLKVFLLNANTPDEIIRQGNIKPGKRTLLTGAGGGYPIRAVANEVKKRTNGKGQLFVIDISPDTFINHKKIHEKFPSVDFVIADASHLPFVSDTFDTTIGDYVFGYISPDSRTNFARELNRTLAPGGEVIQTVTNIQKYQPGELLQLLVQTGLETEQRLVSWMICYNPIKIGKSFYVRGKKSLK